MSSYICMPSHQYIGVEWVTSGFLSKGVYCLRVHYWLVRFLNPLAQSQAGPCLSIGSYPIITFVIFVSQWKSEKGGPHIPCWDRCKVSNWTNYPRKTVTCCLRKSESEKVEQSPEYKKTKNSWEKQKTKNKTLVETVAKYRVEQTPEKNSDMLCEESVWGKCQYSSCWRIIC